MSLKLGGGGWFQVEPTHSSCLLTLQVHREENDHLHTGRCNKHAQRVKERSMKEDTTRTRLYFVTVNTWYRSDPICLPAGSERSRCAQCVSDRDGGVTFQQAQQPMKNKDPNT